MWAVDFSGDGRHGEPGAAAGGAGRLAPRLGRLTAREWWRRSRLRVVDAVLTAGYRLTNLHPAVWKYVVRTYRPGFDRVAERHARLTCAFAAVDVPAYRDLVRRVGATGHRRLADFPETR